MYQLIAIDDWYRQDAYHFFLPYEEPFFNITANIEITYRYQWCQQNNSSFFINLLYDMLVAVNKIEEFRLRIVDDEVRLYDKIHTGSTVLMPNKTFNFCYFDFHPDRSIFIAEGQQRLKDLKDQKPVNAKDDFYNTIHSSVVPWIQFTSVKHARKNTSGVNGIPKITFGKYYNDGAKKMMPISVEVHHSLMDGYHVGLFLEELEKQMGQENEVIQ